MAASFCSVSVRGASNASGFGAWASGVGRALRSTLPFGVSGIASSTTYADGTMYSGSRCFRCVRRTLASSSTPSFAVTYATRRLPSVPSSLAMTTASLTPACDASAVSTSPGSMRKPRTFTCVSRRPRNSSVPSPLQRTTSPVRYSRSPFPNGLGTKRSAVSSGRPTYPTARPSPPTYSSPGTPTGTSCIAPSSTYACVLVMGRPMGTEAPSCCGSSIR